MHLLKFYGHHNILTSIVSSFFETLEEFFNEDCANINKI
jgi:hypothetical protein